MVISLNEISKRIQNSINQTQESIKNQKYVNPEVLKQIIEAIGVLKEASTVANVNMSIIAPNLEQAIESLSSIEVMIEKMKEKETDSLVQSIRKAIIGELEENAREEISSYQFSSQFFQEQRIDLKNLLKAKQKVEKVYKPKT